VEISYYVHGWSAATSYLVFAVVYGEFKAGKGDVSRTVIISVESSREVGSTHRSSDKLVSDTLRTVILANGGKHIIYILSAE
jgi:hypothetical protein